MRALLFLFLSIVQAQAQAQAQDIALTKFANLHLLPDTLLPS